MKKQVIFSLLLLCVGTYFYSLSEKIDNNYLTTDLIVFSFDRPLQLYALIESLDRYVQGINSVVVIYRASNERYNRAFQEVGNQFPFIQLLRQKDIADFKILTVQALKESLSPYILFAVDDNIMKDYVDMGECIEWLENRGSYGFYLKLGTHLTHCYTENCPQRVPEHIVVHDDICAWQFEVGEKDWQYPNTLDMTLYRKEDLLHLFELFNYNNPNFLESAWAAWWAQYKFLASEGLFYRDSKIINIPLNRVQNDILNRDMNLYTPEELLQKFEEGLKIDINPLYLLKNIAVHTEYEPAFVVRG